MITPVDRVGRRRAVHARIRRKVTGTGARPRLAVFRSLKHLYVQVVDDDGRRTLCSASTVDPEVRGRQHTGGNIAAAKVVGEVIAKRLQALGIQQAVFDRGGYRYHGRIRAVAEAAREHGLKF